MKQAPKTLAGLLTLLLALMVSVAMARTTVPQDDQAGQTQSNDQATHGKMEHHAKAHRMTVTGCLEKTADGNGFQITSDKTQKTFTLNPASGMDLSAHVGHTVRVTGAHAAAAAGQPAGQTGMEQLDVKTIKHISGSCKQKPTK